MKDKLLIDCRDVSLGYEGHAIGSHLNFQVHSGEYLCIVGENGSGKSTLLKCLLGLLKPMAGEVVLDNSLRHGAIGYLPQQTPAQKDFPATVYEVVLSGFLNGRRRFFYTPAEKSRALMNMGKLGILELKSKSAISRSSRGDSIAPLYARSAEGTTPSDALNEGYPLELMSLFASSVRRWRRQTVS